MEIQSIQFSKYDWTKKEINQFQKNDKAKV